MDLNTGGHLCLQQTVGGAGTFTGAAFGYAKRTVTAGPASLTVRAKEAGTRWNALRIQLVNPTSYGAYSRTTARHLDDDHLEVVLRSNGAAVQGTAQEVVDAINALRHKTPFAAAVGTDGVMAGTASLVLTGGLDMQLREGIYRAGVSDGTDGGLFYFDQLFTMRVDQIDGKFSGGGTVTVNLVKVDKSLAVVAAESVQLYSAALSAANDFILPDQNIFLQPGQAIQVIATLQGAVRVSAQRDDVG